MFSNIEREKSGRDVMMTCGHYLGRGLKSPPTRPRLQLSTYRTAAAVHSAHKQNSSMQQLCSTTVLTNSAFTVNLLLSLSC